MQVKAQTYVFGQVMDDAKRPLAFVSITLFKDNQPVQFHVADSLGNFNISVNLDKGYRHSLAFSLVGYSTIHKEITDSSESFYYSIILLEDKNVLSNVTVSSTKPMVVRKADRYIVDVENSFLANGNSGLELLQKSPGVWVDANGTIRVKGNQAVTVMVNDLVKRMSEDELAEYLKTLKSEDISKIEVITNPPSEFEAAGSGGIIHIVLKKSRKNGLNGAVNTQYRQQGNRYYITVGQSLDYKIKNFYLFENVSLVKDIKDIYANTSIHYPDNSFYNNHSDRIDDAKRLQYNLGAVYDVNSKQSISIQVSFFKNCLLQNFVTDELQFKNNQTITSRSISNKSRNIFSNNITANYAYKIDSVGSALKVIADYSKISKTEQSLFYADANFLQNRNYRNNVPNSTEIKSLQADLNLGFKKHANLKAGVKYVSINRNNEVVVEDSLNGNWTTNAFQSNHFIYNEQLLMYYASFEKKKKNIIVKAGLRVEHTFSQGNSISTNQLFSRTYFGLFPSFFITQTLNEAKANSIFINYSKRLQRPGLLQLNPARLQFDNYTAVTGNAALQPQFTHTVQMGYTLHSNYMAELYFSKTQDIITLLAGTANNNTIEYTYKNFNNSYEYGLNISAPYTIVNGWLTNNKLSLYHLSYNIDAYKVSQTCFSFKTIHTASFKNLFDVDGIFNYRSAYTNANYAMPAMGSFDFGISKKILKNKARIRMAVADLFNHLYEHEYTDNRNTQIDFYRKRPTRTVSLSFNYSFSSGEKFSNKKVEQGSENIRIGN